MTKPFSALLAALCVAGLGQTAVGQSHPSSGNTLVWPADSQGNAGFLPLERPEGLDRLDSFFVIEPEDVQTAQPPTWVYDIHGADSDDVALRFWSSTRPETWTDEAAPYPIALPGPGFVGLIPRPVPEGWVVTNRCLAWDMTYADADAPLGDCYVFEMRQMQLSLFPAP